MQKWIRKALALTLAFSLMLSGFAFADEASVSDGNTPAAEQAAQQDESEEQNDSLPADLNAGANGDESSEVSENSDAETPNAETPAALEDGALEDSEASENSDVPEGAEAVENSETAVTENSEVSENADVPEDVEAADNSETSSADAAQDQAMTEAEKQQADADEKAIAENAEADSAISEDAASGSAAAEVPENADELDTESAKIHEEEEPNGSKAKATALLLGRPTYGEIGSYEKYDTDGLDQDWYSVYLKAGTQYGFMMVDYMDDFASTSLLVRLFAPDGDETNLSYYMNYYGQSYLYYTADVSGTYYLKLYNYFDNSNHTAEHYYAVEFWYPDCTSHSFTTYEYNDDATCWADGSKTSYCDHGCGATNTVTASGTGGHQYTNYVYNNDATCTQDGTKTAYCDRGCGTVSTVKVTGTKLGHDYVAEEVEPTPGVIGGTRYTCSRCGDYYMEGCTVLSGTYIVTAETRAFSSPAVEDNKIHYYSEGDTVVVTAIDGDWAQLSDGLWVETKYLCDPNSGNPSAEDKLGQGTATRKVTIYSLPTEVSDKLGTIGVGVARNLYAQSGNWYQIYSGGQYVWVRADGFNFTKANTSTKITTAIVTATTSLYYGPGETFGTCGTVDEGRTVNVYEIRTSTERSWFKVYSGGKYVWIDSNYIYDKATGTPSVSDKIGMGKTTKKVTIYSAPDAGSKVLGTVAIGKERNLYAQSGNWYEIYSTINGVGQFCWVRCDGFDYTKASKNTRIGQRYVTEKTTVYYGPGTQYLPVMTLSAGTLVNYYDQKGDWYLVYRSGKYDWIHADYLKAAYIVEYNANNGTTSKSSVTVECGEEYAVAENMFSNGYNSFLGWNDQADGSGTTYEAGTTVTDLAESGATVKLYAQWGVGKYTVEFVESNARVNTTTSMECSFNTTYTMKTPDFSARGYTFTGWNTKSDGTGTSYAAGASFTNLASKADQTVTLYAQWTLSKWTTTEINNLSDYCEDAYTNITRAYTAATNTNYSVSNRVALAQSYARSTLTYLNKMKALADNRVEVSFDNGTTLGDRIDECIAEVEAIADLTSSDKASTVTSVVGEAKTDIAGLRVLVAKFKESSLK